MKEKKKFKEKNDIKRRKKNVKIGTKPRNTKDPKAKGS